MFNDLFSDVKFVVFVGESESNRRKLSLQCRRILGAGALNNPSYRCWLILGEEAREGWRESKVTLRERMTG